MSEHHSLYLSSGTETLSARKGSPRFWGCVGPTFSSTLHVREISTYISVLSWKSLRERLSSVSLESGCLAPLAMSAIHKTGLERLVGHACNHHSCNHGLEKGLSRISWTWMKLHDIVNRDNKYFGVQCLVSLMKISDRNQNHSQCWSLQTSLEQGRTNAPNLLSILSSTSQLTKYRHFKPWISCSGLLCCCSGVTVWHHVFLLIQIHYMAHRNAVHLFRHLLWTVAITGFRGT